MKLNNLLLFGGIGVVLYELYSKGMLNGILGQTQALVNTSGATTTSPSTGTATTSVNAQQNQVLQGLPDTVHRIMNTMVQSGDDPTQLHTVYQWNFYYSAVTGVANTPDPTVVLPNSTNPTTQKIDINTYWAALQSKGFSGMGQVVRMNPSINYVSPGRGNGMRLTGYERSKVN